MLLLEFEEHIFIKVFSDYLTFSTKVFLSLSFLFTYYESKLVNEGVVIGHGPNIDAYDLFSFF